jgi:uncharacterized membrane protein YeiH
MLLTFLDFAGTFVFALSGGTRAVEHRLDPFGVVFLAFVAAASGGIVRDVLIGTTPPAAIASWHYCAISCAAGIACYFAYGPIRRLSAPVAVFDAFGLGLFAVVGARKALDAGLTPLMAAFLGMMTAIGGGIARDILTAQTPMVLRKDVYALAALAGAAIVAFGDYAGFAYGVTAPVGAAVTTCVRLFTMRRNWNLPEAKPDP